MPVISFIFFLTQLIVVVPLGVEFQITRVEYIPMRVIFDLWDLILILNPQKSLFGHCESILVDYYSILRAKSQFCAYEHSEHRAGSLFGISRS